jgi:hypothetical protein
MPTSARLRSATTVAYRLHRGPACALATALLAAAALPWVVAVAAGCLIVVVLVSCLWRCTGRGVPRAEA